MKVSSSTESVATLDVDVLVITVHSDGFGPTAANVNQCLDGQLDQLIADGEMATSIGRMLTLYNPKGIKAKTLIVCGGGSKAEPKPSDAVRIAGAAAKRLADRSRKRVAMALDLDETLTAYAVSAAVNGFVGQDLYRTEKNFQSCDELLMLTPHADAVKRGIDHRREHVAGA